MKSESSKSQEKRKKIRQRSDKTAELLAPAGSVQACLNAFMEGADAVYIGGSRFGARAYADNPSEEELLELIDLAHRLGKKLYMTVNTLLKDRETEYELYDFLRPFAEEGLDGVIVQDFGAADLMKNAFPDLRLHASTQMAVTGVHGARFLAEAGFSRIVPARELSLDEIRHIHEETGIEIEAFAHGAMCYSYSGMCLMSSLIGGRSGNRGRCAGVCRLPFDVYEDGRRLGGGIGRYPLNMKDMCTIDILPEMLDSGITSFKIEGRMKKPEYTAGVVKIYRKYIDMALTESGNYSVDPADRRLLYDLFNRDGFNEGYYHERNGRGMIAVRNRGDSDGGAASQAVIRKLRSELDSPEKVKKLQAPVIGKLTLRKNEPAVLSVTWTSEKPAADRPGKTGQVQNEEVKTVSASASCEGVQEAEKVPITTDRVRRQINKTGGGHFYFSRLDIEMDEGLFVPVGVLNRLRREALEKLDREIKNSFRREPAAGGISGSHGGEGGRSSRNAADRTRITGSVRPGTASVRADGFGELPAYVLVNTPGQLHAAGRCAGKLSGIYVPADLFNDGLSGSPAEEALSDFEDVRLVLPHIMRERNEKRIVRSIAAYREYCGKRGIRPAFLVRNIEETGLLLGERHIYDDRTGSVPEAVIADAGMYTMNSRAAGFWRERGIAVNTMPLELNAGEMRHRDNYDTELVIYGRSPMMISAQCLRKTMAGCDHGNDILKLLDRKNTEFPAVCCCSDCFNVIYNSLPTSLLPFREEIGRLRVNSLRLEFTLETGGETYGIITAFAGERSGEENLRGSFTRGHFHRGVE